MRLLSWVTMLVLVAAAGLLAAENAQEGGDSSKNRGNTVLKAVTKDGEPVEKSGKNGDAPAREQGETPAASVKEPPNIEELQAMLSEFEHATHLGAQEDMAARISEGAKARLGEMLERVTGNASTSVGVIRLLGFAQSAEANARLAKLLDSPDAAVRGAAAFALGVSGEKSAFDKLAKLLDDRDAKAAGQAAIAVGRLRDERSYAALEKRLKSKELLGRLAVIRALGLLGDKRGVARLEEHLRSSDDPLETTAVLDALNLIAGTDLFRVIAQFERVAAALQKHGTGMQTQLAQAALTEALSRFIQQMEEAENQQQGGGGAKRQTSSGRRPGGSASSSPSQGSSPATQSGPRESNGEAAFAEIARTAGHGWGNLPPAVQEEIVASLKQELPERYQRLLRIYYKILAEGK